MQKSWQENQNTLTAIFYPLIGWIGGLSIIFFLFLKFQNFILNLDKLGKWVAASVPGFNPPHDYLIGILIGIAVATIIIILPIPRRFKYILLLGWIFRLIVVFILMPYYEGHYSILDAYSYVHSGLYEYSLSLLSSLGFEVGRGTDNISRLCGLIYYLLPFTWYGTKVIFSAIGMWGAVLFFKGFQQVHPKINPSIISAILLFHPSITFWSSIIGKDPIMFFFIGIYFYGNMGFLSSGKNSKLAIALMGSLLMLFIRPWMTSITIIALSLYLTTTIKKTQRTLYIPVILILGISAIAVFLSFFGIHSLGDLVDKADRISKGWAHGGSALEVPNITSLPVLIMFLPKAMFTTLFRPLLFEVRNPFGWLAGSENTTMLLFFIYAMYKLKRAHLKDLALRFALIYSAIWTTIYAIPCYQNLGTAERYRLQVLPFILLIIVIPLYLKDKSQTPPAFLYPHRSNHAWNIKTSHR